MLDRLEPNQLITIFEKINSKLLDKSSGITTGELFYLSWAILQKRSEWFGVDWRNGPEIRVKIAETTEAIHIRHKSLNPHVDRLILDTRLEYPDHVHSSLLVLQRRQLGKRRERFKVRAGLADIYNHLIGDHVYGTEVLRDISLKPRQSNRVAEKLLRAHSSFLPDNGRGFESFVIVE